MSQLQQYFEPILGKQRTKNRIAAIALIVGGIAAAAWVFSQDYTQYPVARLGALSIIIVPVALIFLGVNLRPHKGLATLADPSRIVWYYGVLKSGHVVAVMIGFDDGELHRFPLPLISIKEGFSQEALQLLHAAAPHASSGFSEELRVAFHKDPPSLKSSRPV